MEDREGVNNVLLAILLVVAAYFIINGMNFSYMGQSIDAANPTTTDTSELEAANSLADQQETSEDEDQPALTESPDEESDSSEQSSTSSSTSSSSTPSRSSASSSSSPDEESDEEVQSSDDDEQEADEEESEKNFDSVQSFEESSSASNSRVPWDERDDVFADWADRIQKSIQSYGYIYVDPYESLNKYNIKVRGDQMVIHVMSILEDKDLPFYDYIYIDRPSGDAIGFCTRLKDPRCQGQYKKGVPVDPDRYPFVSPTYWIDQLGSVEVTGSKMSQGKNVILLDAKVGTRSVEVVVDDFSKVPVEIKFLDGDEEMYIYQEITFTVTEADVALPE